MKVLYKPTPSNRTEDATRQEKDVSGQLVRLIDFLFGLVIVQGALFYRPILAAGGHRNVPVIMALALGMYTVVRSFVDWHTLMEHTPYQIMTSSRKELRPWSSRSLQVRTLELWRLYVDFIIVAAYSVVLLRGHVLLSDPSAGLRMLFWSFPGIFFLYLIWGEFLRLSSGKQQFNEWLLVISLLVSAALAIMYGLAYDGDWFRGHGTIRNVGALAIEAAIMMGYRYLNWKQQRSIKRPRPA